MVAKQFPASAKGEYRRVRVVAPASAVNQEAIWRTVEALSGRGFEVTLGDHVFDVWHEVLRLAGRDVDRAKDLVAALEDPAVDWILAARGGYGALRLLPYLPQPVLDACYPKPLVGFSDITVLHVLWHRMGWWSIHGPNAEADWRGAAGESVAALLNPTPRLIAAEASLQCLAHPLDTSLTAPWCGGNLTLLTALLGTPLAPRFDGCILYLEEVNEAPYRIDRMLQQIKLAGHFGHIRGVIFGDATGDEDHEGSEVRAILSEWGERVGLPVWWGFPSSHRSPTLAVPLGIPCTIDPSGRVSLAGSAAAQHA